MKKERTITLNISSSTDILLDSDIDTSSVISKLLNEELKKELKCCKIEKVERKILENATFTVHLEIPTEIA